MRQELEEKWSRLSDKVEEEMKKRAVPGVALGVLHGDALWTAGFGVTSLDHPLPVTDDTLFQIGSITKTFTGTAVMRLVEMGKLELDATVRTYLPEFKVSDEAAASQATLRHLLTHTGGWEGDFFHDTGPGDGALARYVSDMAELKQLAPLGAHFSYCNSGFAVAGHLIEQVTGKSYREALQELILEPLGLERCFLDPGDVITHRFAVGHNAGQDGPEVARPWSLPWAVYPVGAIICPVEDLLRYARFHMGDGTAGDGTRLLAPESLSLMRSTQVPVWGDRSWGLTWSLRDLNGTRMVSHGGGTKGQVSQLALIPSRGFALAVFTNSNEGGQLCMEVLRQALKEYLELDLPRPEPIEASEGELAVYVGRHSRPFADLELGILGGRLVGQMTVKAGFPSRDVPPPPPPPPMALALCEKDCLLVLDGPMKEMLGEVLRNPDGSIGWVRAGSRLYPRQT
jgi:CubicO group peptidase (beta-lactamase class C family)